MLDLKDAISLLEQGEAHEAARLLEEMSGEMPGYATARVLLARAYEGMDEWNDALRVWRDALHIIPNSPVVLRGLARAAGKAASTHVAPSGFASDLDDGFAPEARADYPPEIGPNEASSEAWPDEPYAEGAPSAPSEVWPNESPFDVEPSEPFVEPEPDAPEPDALQRNAPEPNVPDQEDLDRLINELQSARIVPRPDLDNLPPPDLEDDIEDVVSETLARIYATQGQYDEAARVYELLAGQQPEKRDEFMNSASEMRTRASDQG